MHELHSQLPTPNTSQLFVWLLPPDSLVIAHSCTTADKTRVPGGGGSSRASSSAVPFAEGLEVPPSQGFGGFRRHRLRIPQAPPHSRVPPTSVLRQIVEVVNQTGCESETTAIRGKSELSPRCARWRHHKNVRDASHLRPKLTSDDPDPHPPSKRPCTVNESK